MNIGAYELLETLGKGGMGTVYRARHRETNEIVAIKVMAVEVAADPVLVKRFEQEYEAARRLRHPNLVQGFDYGLEEGRAFLVMEFVEGPNLRLHVKKQGPFPETEAIRLTLQVADALEVAHQNQLIHRDVKPDNILLAKDGQAKLTDLGLIKDINAPSDLTRSRTCLGTLAYMAPEQWENARGASPRCDIYGLAATFYYAITGAVPFHGRGNLTILRKKLHNDLVPPRRLVPTLSVQVDEAICKALDADPARRQSSCREFAAMLQGARPAPDRGRRGHIGAFAAKVGSGGSGGSGLKDRRTSRRYQCPVDAWCWPLAGGDRRWDAEVQDVSLSGVRLRVNRCFEPGAVLSLVLLTDQSKPVSTSLVRVRWVREVPEQQWNIGCAFNRELSEQELNSILEIGPHTAVIHLSNH